MCDSQGACDLGLVQWTVYPTNSSPNASGTLLNTNEDTPISYNLASLVTDLEGGALNYTLLTANAQAINSSVSISGLLEFIPNAQSFGSMPITYRVCDSGGLCDTAEV
ncbi:MAG: Ig-like domain-containing protein, partial [Flavobacteriales bacterium]